MADIGGLQELSELQERDEAIFLLNAWRTLRIFIKPVKMR